MSHATANLVSQEELRAESAADETLQQVRQYLTTEWPRDVSDREELVPYHRVRHELSVFNDVCIARRTRAVIPKSLQYRVTQLAHAGHPGIVKMKKKCRETVWWPGIDKCVEDHVRVCESCCLSEKAGSTRPAPLQPVPWPQKPWKELQIDIFGEVKAAPQNEIFLVVIHDVHSKWPEIATTGTVTIQQRLSKSSRRCSHGGDYQNPSLPTTAHSLCWMSSNHS